MNLKGELKNKKKKTANLCSILFFVIAVILLKFDKEILQFFIYLHIELGLWHW